MFYRKKKIALQHHQVNRIGGSKINHKPVETSLRKMFVALSCESLSPVQIPATRSGRFSNNCNT